MKNLLIVLIILYSVLSPAFAELTDNEILQKSLSNAVDQFRELSQPRRVFRILRRDPMQSLIDDQGNLIHSAEVSEGLILQGVFVSGENKMVLINDRFYNEGATAGPYKILEIRSDGFLAQQGDKKPTFFPLHPKSES